MDSIHKRMKLFATSRRWKSFAVLILISFAASKYIIGVVSRVDPGTNLHVELVKAILSPPPGSMFDETKCQTEYIPKLKSGDLTHRYLQTVEKVITEKILGPNTIDVAGHAVVRPLLNCFDQKDPYLHRVIAEDYLHKGDRSKRRFTNQYAALGVQPQTTDLLNHVFKEKRNGVFLECGSVDGEFLSVSLSFELDRNWTGILLEADPSDYQLGLLRNRDVYYMNTCLGPGTTPRNIRFLFEQAIVTQNNKLVNARGGVVVNQEGEGVDMQCFPLYSIIKASGFPTINLLILDIEGAEFAVLNTIPWDLVDIEVMTIETDLVGGAGLPGGSQRELREFVVSKGYTLYEHSSNFNNITELQNNDLFVRNDLAAKLDISLKKVTL